MKTLLLTFNIEGDNNFMLKKMSEAPNIDVFSALRNLSTFKKVVRRVDYLTFGLFWNIWITDSWRSKIEDYDLVVCIAGPYSDCILRWINRKYGVRCINYFWDKISVARYKVCQRKEYENWSFNREDADMYNMKFNPQFYVSGIQLRRDDVAYDVSFVGSDRNGDWKERIGFVNEVYSSLSLQDMNLYFWLVSNVKNDKTFIHSEYLSMDKYFEIMEKSKAVLEIVNPGQEWLTLRVFQALSNNIKLITNNKKIINERFYNSNNIFIWGVDDISRLDDFINSEFDASIDLSYYTMDSWNERFYE